MEDEMPGASAEERTRAAFRAFGARISSLEAGQAKQEAAASANQQLILSKLEGISTQVAQGCVLSGKLEDRIDKLNGRIDIHETSIALLAKAWEEQIMPALNRLRNLELKVAAGALIGGGAIAALIELIGRLAH